MSKIIRIIGAGPAGLMAAQRLATEGYQVHVYEHMKASARKFLVAGHGGFNITHNEPIETFVQKYNAPQLASIVRHFDNTAVVKWLHELGINTFIGSSGKIFPQKNIKPITVLQQWLHKLDKLGVEIHYEHALKNFDDSQVQVNHKGQTIELPYDHLILAMGGASWPITGAIADWVPILRSKGIPITALESANSGYNTREDFSMFAGQVLKNIAITYDQHTRKGEVVFTTYGIEGAPIYFMNRYTRASTMPTKLYLDLKPQWTLEECTAALDTEGNITKTLRTSFKLSKTAINLIKKVDKDTYMNARALAQIIKSYPIEITSLRPIDEVISTAGGVAWSALTEGLAMVQYPNVYCIGEMVDWEAPTGGYLLQACFSMGTWAANDIIQLSNS